MRFIATIYGLISIGVAVQAATQGAAEQAIASMLVALFVLAYGLQGVTFPVSRH
jgi:hypothetical protein